MPPCRAGAGVKRRRFEADGVRFRVSIRREDAERFIEEVCGDDSRSMERARAERCPHALRTK